MDLRALGLSPLLVGLRNEEIEALLGAAQLKVYRDGAPIVAEGTPGDTMYMLKAGAVVVEKKSSEGHIVELAMLDAQGDFFGEMVFVDVLQRSATVRAYPDAHLLGFPLEMLQDFFRTYPDAHLAIVLNIARGLSKRLRGADDQIVALKEKYGIAQER
ncbi:MAG: cyclic nucleotide-binding domain-containing protein [bacterium]|nr:cyclic nucleotide-binding domain-containing protein [bacterium]